MQIKVTKIMGNVRNNRKWACKCGELSQNKFSSNNAHVG